MTNETPSRKQPRPRWPRRALLILVPLLLAGGWYAWPQLFGKQDALADYQFATVERGDIEDVVTATGTLQPRDYVDVGAQVSGQLKEIHVEVGDTVKEGELLAQIDPTVYRARVDASRAQLRNLRAQLKDREAQLTLAQIQLRRQRALMAEDATTRESLQTAEASAQSAAAQLEALRAQLNAKHGAGRGRLTVLPFVLRALVLAVREFPSVNARYDDEAGVVTRHGGVHVGIATQTDAGLVVPVLRHAEALDLWATAAEIARLAQSARSGRALREELSGSTITVTSLGALGGIASTPVINRPEVAIVGVNRIVERPVIRGGAVVARKMMNLSSSFDHRVVDGMHAAEFVQALRGYLECPATMFVD